MGDVKVRPPPVVRVNIETGRIRKIAVGHSNDNRRAGLVVALAVDVLAESPAALVARTR